MEQGRRKQVMIGIIIVCFAIAGYMTFGGGGGGGGGREVIPEDATVWVKCLNPRCKATYEMNKIAYRDFQRAHLAEDEEPGMVCEKCSKPSAYKAEKCLSCGTVFVMGEAGPGKPGDQCPKCGAVQSELRGAQ